MGRFLFPLSNGSPENRALPPDECRAPSNFLEFGFLTGNILNRSIAMYMHGPFFSKMFICVGYDVGHVILLYLSEAWRAFVRRRHSLPSLITREAISPS